VCGLLLPRAPRAAPRVRCGRGASGRAPARRDERRTAARGPPRRPRTRRRGIPRARGCASGDRGSPSRLRSPSPDRTRTLPSRRDGLAQPRDEFWGARRDGELIALLHLGGQSGAVLPIGGDPEALQTLARVAIARLPQLPRRFQVIGPRAAVAAVADRLAEIGRTPRLRREQI